MKNYYAAILCFLFFGSFCESSAQINNGYFEYLNHIEQQTYSNFLPISESDAYVWTGRALIRVGPDTIQNIYQLPFGSGAESEFYTSDTDTTIILNNIFATDVGLTEIIILKKNGDVLDEKIFNKEIYYLNSIAPFVQASYLALTNQNEIVIFDNDNNIEIVSQNLSGRNNFATNNRDIYLFNQNNQTGELIIYSTLGLQLTPLFQSQIDVAAYQVSNDSIAAILSNESIVVIDLKTGTIENEIALDASFGADHIFSANENFDQFYIFSNSDKAYINRYDTAGNRTLLFTEETPDPQNIKIAIQDNLIYTLGNLYRSGHFKVQEDQTVEATDRKDLQLNELQVFFAGIDTTMSVIPTTPPDTIISFTDKYEYTLEVENIDNETLRGYNAFSNSLFRDIPFDIIDQSFINMTYFEPINPGEKQIHTQAFRTPLDIESVSFTLEGIEDMPDADYTNNFVVDMQFDIVSARELQSKQYQVSIYPNPSSEIINIKSELDIYGAQIYDTSGSLQYAKFRQSPIFDIELSSLQSGIYFLQLINKEGIPIAVEKITKL